MKAKSSNQLELELLREEKTLERINSDVEADDSNSAVLLSFSLKHQQRAADEERRLLDAIGERAAHLLHFLRKIPESR